MEPLDDIAGHRNDGIAAGLAVARVVRSGDDESVLFGRRLIAIDAVDPAAAGIEREEPALTAEAPTHYLRTSGTTGRPKDIPLVASHLNLLRRINRVSVSSQHRVRPAAFTGSILVITSPAFEGTLANGKPYGSASGIVSGSTPPLVREKFVVPAPVLTIADSRVKYLLILRLAIARRDITYLGTANRSRCSR